MADFNLETQTTVLNGFPVIARAVFVTDDGVDYIEEMTLFTPHNERATFIESKLRDTDWDEVAHALFKSLAEIH